MIEISIPEHWIRAILDNIDAAANEGLGAKDTIAQEELELWILQTYPDIAKEYWFLKNRLPHKDK